MKKLLFALIGACVSLSSFASAPQKWTWLEQSVGIGGYPSEMWKKVLTIGERLPIYYSVEGHHVQIDCSLRADPVTRFTGDTPVELDIVGLTLDSGSATSRTYQIPPPPRTIHVTFKGRIRLRGAPAGLYFLNIGYATPNVMVRGRCYAYYIPYASPMPLTPIFPPIR